MATNINTILGWFTTGKKPTQGQFWASWQSFWHKDEQIPQSSITNLTSTLNAKTEKSQFEAHKTDQIAHAELFITKENKSNKGVAGGYAPLDSFTKLASQYLSIVNDLTTGGATELLSAEQGKNLKGQIDAINIVLASDNFNLDTVQEIVDAIETMQTSLDSILVNDLVTGGTTKALTAEMGKILQTSKVDKVTGKGLSTEDYSTQEKTQLAGIPASLDLKENKSNKGIADGYAPLDSFTKLAAQYLNIVNDLTTGGATELLSAEQGKNLKGQIDAINIILASDNFNLDTVQELVDAIETIQTSLGSILVNDLVTGGTTKALTAEMGKTLKGLIDGFVAPVSTLQQVVEVGKTSTLPIEVMDVTIGQYGDTDKPSQGIEITYEDQGSKLELNHNKIALSNQDRLATLTDNELVFNDPYTLGNVNMKYGVGTISLENDAYTRINTLMFRRLTDGEAFYGFPEKPEGVYTLATLDDIPASTVPTLQEVLENGDTATDANLVIVSGSGQDIPTSTSINSDSVKVGLGGNMFGSGAGAELLVLGALNGSGELIHEGRLRLKNAISDGSNKSVATITSDINSTGISQFKLKRHNSAGTTEFTLATLDDIPAQTTPTLQQVLETGAGAVIGGNSAKILYSDRGEYRTSFTLSDGIGDIETNFGGTKNGFGVNTKYQNITNTIGLSPMSGLSSNDSGLRMSVGSQVIDGYTYLNFDTPTQSGIADIRLPQKVGVHTIAMLDDIPAQTTPTLQQVLDAGNTSTYKNLTLDSGVNDYATTFSYQGFRTQTGASYLRNTANSIEGWDGNNGINLNFTGRTQSGYGNFGFPDKSAGYYTLATLDDIPESSPLSKLDEGNGNGYRLSNADPLNFGNIGADAVDFSYSDTPSAIFGATGSGAFAMGNYVAAGGYSSVVFGNDIVNTGIGSFDSGINLRDSGYTNTLFGIGHDVTSMNTMVVGQAANIIDTQILDFNATPTKPLFVVGNGTIQNNDEDYAVLTRSDALIARMNGSVEAPSLTNSMIDDDVTGKVLVTKEWVQTQTSTPAYKLYTANVSVQQAQQTSGILIIGETYQIFNTPNEGDDFSNIGWLGDSNPFIAINTTPINWTNGSGIYYNAITVHELENTLGSTVNINYDISNPNDAATLTITNGIFTDANKIWVHNPNSSLWSITDSNNLDVGEINNDNTPKSIEIRVYN